MLNQVETTVEDSLPHHVHHPAPVHPSVLPADLCLCISSSRVSVCPGGSVGDGMRREKEKKSSSDERTNTIQKKGDTQNIISKSCFWINRDGFPLRPHRTTQSYSVFAQVCLFSVCQPCVAVGLQCFSLTNATCLYNNKMKNTIHIFHFNRSSLFDLIKYAPQRCQMLGTHIAHRTRRVFKPSWALYGKRKWKMV